MPIVILEESLAPGVEEQAVRPASRTKWQRPPPTLTFVLLHLSSFRMHETEEVDQWGKICWEILCAGRRGVREELGGRVLFHDLTVSHEDDAISGLAGEAHLVRRRPPRVSPQARVTITSRTS